MNDNIKHPAEIDLAVLLIFFARPDTLKEVFKRVKKARPSKLFLACDGPRKGNVTDASRIEECKKIVSDIDWECELHTLYSEANKGCGKGPSEAISWAFAHTDKLVILEDDCVPEMSFFPYMKELLDKYENDDRIGIISGFNHFQSWDCGGNSYCFTKCAATLGWGTWKRVWDNYDFYVKNAADPYYARLLEQEIINKRAGKGRCNSWKAAAIETKEKKVRYWDIQFGFVKYSQSYLCIVPKENLIYNIGIGEGSTHTANARKTEWKMSRVLFMPVNEMKFPLVHPEYIICDRAYDEKHFRLLSYPHPIVKYYRKIRRRLLEG